MANQNVTMSKLKKAFQLLAANVPQRQICEQIRMGRGVLAKYKKAADERHLSYADAGRMSDEDLERFLKSTKTEVEPSSQRVVMDDLVASYVDDLAHNRYLTIQRLHEKYREEHPDGYGYTQFKKLIRDYQYAHNLSFHNTYLPGDEIQIDFAGDPLWLTDKKTGEITKIPVLVCILPYSGLGFAKALPNASMEYLFGALSDALEFYGGITKRAKSDNMSQWVKKHDRYEPVFNDEAVRWSAYYDVQLDACRVRRPRDKGPVEGLVQKVYNAVYAEIRDEIFYDLNTMNSRISELMDVFNCKVSKVTGRSRMDIFESEEKSTLQPLPMQPYRFRYRKEVKLTSGYHVCVGKRKYSVPYQYVGQMVTVLWDIDTVEVYSGAKRIAIHERNGIDPYSTVDSHMPEEHQEWKHGQGYNAAYFMEEAEATGPCTSEAMAIILKRNSHVEQGYRSCQGVLSLKRKYGHVRLENACRRLKGCGSITYTMIKNILEKNLDKAGQQTPVANVPQNDYVRGSKAFKL